jgi:hypothetical protein
MGALRVGEGFSRLPLRRLGRGFGHSFTRHLAFHSLFRHWLWSVVLVLVLVAVVLVLRLATRGRSGSSSSRRGPTTRF